MSLKPIKRSEMILDGQDIEPVTRLEYFLKKAAEGGGGGDSGQYVKVYESNEVLSESIPVVSDINGQTMQYTSGMPVIARNYDNNQVRIVLADAQVLNSPFVIRASERVLLTDRMFNNIVDINPFIPAGEKTNADFYVKEISANAKCASVADSDGNLLIVDSNYVTLGYGYTGYGYT